MLHNLIKHLLSGRSKALADCLCVFASDTALRHLWSPLSAALPWICLVLQRKGSKYQGLDYWSRDAPLHCSSTPAAAVFQGHHWSSESLTPKTLQLGNGFSASPIFSELIVIIILAILYSFPLGAYWMMSHCRGSCHVLHHKGHIITLGKTPGIICHYLWVGPEWFTLCVCERRCLAVS